MHRCRYLVVSPCRNEAAFARVTIESVLAQTIRPARWIIVDDGSTDSTPSTLSEFAKKHDWITVITRKNRGRRSVGPGVVDAFYEGLESAGDLNQYEYLCKLDLDLKLPPRYFELLIERMQLDPDLGTCSGKPYFPRSTIGRRSEALLPSQDRALAENADLVSERIGDDMSAGMTKFYRVTCFRDIGGFVREVMWDGIDCHRCRMLGWKAGSWDDPELRFVHLRPMGSSQSAGLFRQSKIANLWNGRVRHGYGQWFMGTGPLYMTISAAYRMSRPPLLIGGFAMWWGYISSMIRQRPRYPDRNFRKFLRSYQWSVMLVGKRRAVERLRSRRRHAAQLHALRPWSARSSRRSPFPEPAEASRNR